MKRDFYTEFYKKTERSETHSAFCRNVYGIDLNQHGFAGLEQLKLLIEMSSMHPGQSILDVGCGNGGITEYLSSISGANVTGIDDSREAILQAQQRSNDGKLKFRQGDINDLHLQNNAYDSIILIDSIYFSNDYRKTIQDLTEALKKNGRILIFYSIGPALLGTDDIPIEILNAKNTPLAKTFAENGVSFLHIDLTDRDHALAVKRKAYLEAHREAFMRERLGFIYQNRMDEANDIINAVLAEKHRRYLYCAQIEN